jgi:hypothetical protein
MHMQLNSRADDQAGFIASFVILQEKLRKSFLLTL